MNKIKDLWYFVLWLVADIKFTQILIISNIIIVCTAWWMPPAIGKYFFAYVLVTYLIVAINFCFITPLIYSYKKYKDQQKDLFNTIKNSDD